MKFYVFNVGHGFCAALIADNGHVTLFDCGHDDEKEFWPSVWLLQNGIRRVNRLIVSHYDDDHVSDLPLLLQPGASPSISRQAIKIK